MSNPFVRFLFVGGLNTLFGLSVYILLTLSGMPTWAVLIVTNLAGIAFNFFTTGGLVFRDLSVTRVPRFLLWYSINFLIYLALIEWLSPILGGKIWTMVVIISPMTVLNYFVQSGFVFGGRKNKHK